MCFITVNTFSQNIKNSSDTKLTYKVRTQDGKVYYSPSLLVDNKVVIIEDLDGKKKYLNEGNVIGVREIINGINYFEWKEDGFTEYVVTKVDSVKVGKLYSLVIAWIKETYENPSKVIKAEFENNKVRVQAIKSNGLKEEMLGVRFFDISYSFEVTVRDGRYKLDALFFSLYAPTISNRNFISNGKFSQNFYNKNGQIKKSFKFFPINAEDLFNDLNLSLYSYILKNSKSDLKDDW